MTPQDYADLVTLVKKRHLHRQRVRSAWHILFAVAIALLLVMWPIFVGR